MQHLNRRDAMVRLGGLGALTLPGLLRQQRVPASETQGRGKAKSCIYLFLWGGPPQQDMWDLKPDAPQGIRSLFQPIQTVVPGVHVCDQMPLLAQQMDKVAVVRSVCHACNEHEASVYHMMTGKQNPSLRSPRNFRRRTDFPNLASIISFFSPPGNMPATVTIPRPIGHDGITYAGTYSGFLGPRYDPMELHAAPNSNDEPAYSISLPSEVNLGRLSARKGLLHSLENKDRFLQQSRSTEGLGSFYEQAFRMVSSPLAKRAFNLDLESPASRDLYGRNEYGESFLLARRLIEAGVRLVSIIWMYFMRNGRIANVWDTHGSVGEPLGRVSGFDMLKAEYCIPPLDRAYSALIKDLAARGLLEETLVVAVGEFGRTPKINDKGGREHWGMCQSALLAGGGVRGGQVYGASDKTAAFVKDKPVSPEDLLATVYYAMGLPPAGEVRDRNNRPYRVCEGKPVTGLFT